ncbi:MAG: gliding motility-associated C-terminal domain-containing protein [Bacteroidetes bacterium]|nr:gliding motility-associated C-terminal domain-containing protein [Bacteroidota bacterium]
MQNVLKINFFIPKAKRAYALFAFILFSLSLKSQINLIPNPSFENLNSTPTTCNNFSSLSGWYSLIGASSYLNSLSINNCFGCMVSSPGDNSGYQIPKSGIAKAGIVTRSLFANTGNLPFSNGTNLIGVKLSNKLVKDHIYNFSMYYSLVNGVTYLSNQLSAYFSVTQFTVDWVNFNPLSQNWYDNNINFVNPQINNDTSQYLSDDTLNWTKFGGCFKANGNEEFVTIGNFRDGAKTKTKPYNSNFNFPCSNLAHYDGCFIYIDDISLYDIGYYSGKAQCKRDTTICFNSNLVIGNNIKDSSVIAWQVHPSLSCTNCLNPIASPTITTTYYVTKTLCSFITKDSITVTVFTPSVNANAGIDKQLCFNQNATLGINDSTNFANYLWQPNQFLNCNNCATPIANPNTTITYTLQKTECGIISKDTVRVISEDCETTYEIPNVFTPNGDNVNETWGINFSQTKYIKNFNLTIYNRWGVLILLSEKPNLKWDGHTTSGEVCSDGVYFYTTTFELNGEQKTFKGNVTLIR